MNPPIDLQVTVKVAPNGAWSVRWDGDMGLAMAILGGLEYAKHQAVAEMNHHVTTPKVKGASKMAKRADALNYYLDLRQTIEQRLQAINNSAEQAEFELPMTEI